MSDEQKKSEIDSHRVSIFRRLGAGVKRLYLYNAFSFMNDKSGDNEDDELACV